jgi:hypothetical protein
MLRAVSFRPLPRRPILTPTIGGSVETEQKALNGAAFTTPLADMLVTQAIGRGTIQAIINL